MLRNTNAVQSTAISTNETIGIERYTFYFGHKVNVLFNKEIALQWMRWFLGLSISSSDHVENQKKPIVLWLAICLLLFNICYVCSMERWNWIEANWKQFSSLLFICFLSHADKVTGCIELLFFIWNILNAHSTETQQIICITAARRTYETIHWTSWAARSALPYHRISVEWLGKTVTNQEQ